MQLLKELTEANGVSGFEKEVREVMKRELSKENVEIQTDGLGGIFGIKKGTSDRPRILLAGHLDEVGFMVTEITKSGYLRFTPLGGWWSQVLLSQRVLIITEQRTFTGVIGSRPPHVLTPEEKGKLIPIREMFIDIGAHSDEQVKEWGIRVGDPIVPVCPFEILPDRDTILAKALDNRAGCYLALEVLKQLSMADHPNTVIAGATVQEEVGLRGATTAPRLLKPDVAIALDVGVAEDSPGSEGQNKAKLGKGPLITFLDATMIPNLSLRNYVVKVAEKHGIPFQIDTMTGGGTDAGQFHLYGKGVPSIVIGVAARYIHSHVSMISKSDLDHAVRLLVEVVKGLNQDQYNEFIQYV
ncbi:MULTISPECIES: M42 family metallopeptidase [Thermoactinomyces]|jgi:putative aminopeptidase FrvX|uniref:M42 family metallopeptidase n=1 Tax=Thermoactinomyces vulgaris TaxID=2026 RepID=A0ABS0QIB7_THEVU|nr:MULTISPECIES: M42 family metallopeptidase [Thermoactinomyces]KFZ40762.1 peptidase M28 [Thermoactinomyces sp. Gus2-1]KYQ86862.1 peptidase M28 [Thermoactinomyces sp. AS95]MBA4551777.1 M42 family metallopeptidase [Thermoactinomyces vulgaris]MBA4596344.1 M42 family metallopeptidase [Thermoactinomyces vulgaris]MBH8582925.1 M42 family metallopeptidase [Thermoactinomyces sp. CICC 10735]